MSGLFPGAVSGAGNWAGLTDKATAPLPTDNAPLAAALAAKGSGTVTATAGALTANAVVLGAGGADTKIATGITTDGASQLNLGVSATTAGKIKLYGPTSGDATLQTTAAAGTAVVITLPALTSTLATLGANTFTGAQSVQSLTAVTNIFCGNAYGFLWGTRSQLYCNADGELQFANQSGSKTVSFTVSANATFSLGASNAASPVAQTLSAQGSRSGTDTNVSGAKLTVATSDSTGSAVPSALAFASSQRTTSGTGLQTKADTFTVQNGATRRAAYTLAGMPISPVTGDETLCTDALAPTFLGAITGGGSVLCGARWNGANWVAF